MGQSQFPDRTGKKVHYIDVFARPTWAEGRNGYACRRNWSGQAEWSDEEMRRAEIFYTDCLDVSGVPHIRVFMFHKVKHYEEGSVGFPIFEKEENKDKSLCVHP